MDWMHVGTEMCGWQMFGYLHSECVFAHAQVKQVGQEVVQGVQVQCTGNYVYEIRIDKKTKKEKTYFLKYFAESRPRRSI